MNKYLLAAKNTWNQTLTYRMNFVMWRVRTVLALLTSYFLWFSIIPANAKLESYTQQSILTYILLASFVGAIVFSSLVGQVGDEINNGDLSNFLIRPINYFYYWFAKDIGDKAMNIFFSAIELFLLIIILHPPIFLQTKIMFLMFTVVSIIEAVLLHFLINFLLGFIAFWSSEIWAPRFIFYTVYSFFSGGFFPLDIMPKKIYTIFTFLPFTYLQFFPIKIYLGQESVLQIISGLSIAFFWIFLLAIFARFIWKIGLMRFTAQGR